MATLNLTSEELQVLDKALILSQEDARVRTYLAENQEVVESVREKTRQLRGNEVVRQIGRDAAGGGSS